MVPQSGGQVLHIRSAGWNSVCYKISLFGYQRCGDDALGAALEILLNSLFLALLLRQRPRQGATD